MKLKWRLGRFAMKVPFIRRWMMRRARKNVVKRIRK